jgi:class 3 adenylate cyclase
MAATLSEVAMGERPFGPATLLFTDIECSTRLWQEDEASMRQADQLLGEVISDHGRVVFSTMGGGVAAAVSSSSSTSGPSTRGLPVSRTA